MLDVAPPVGDVPMPSTPTPSMRSVAPSTADIAQRWMEMVLGEKFAQGFPMALVSGMRLCMLVNKVFQALGMDDRRCEILRTAWPCPENDPTLQLEMDESWWERQKSYAKRNIDQYLCCCREIGVDATDFFATDDLLELVDLDRVYENILALQDVAISLSHRRSIDERSSTDLPGKQFKESTPSSPPRLSTTETFNASVTSKADKEDWVKVLEAFEEQQLRKAAADDLSEDPIASGGLGKLAHDIWVTEETIRMMLMCEDESQLVLVPHHLHGKLWLLASGASEEMRRQPGQYATLVEIEGATNATRQIDADLNRTVNITEMPEWDNEKTLAMRRVLVAFSHFDHKIGYCQGLNYIVARLLQFVNEEEAFYLLIKIIALVPDDYYTSMLGVAVDQHVFADLVRLQIPEVMDHLKELGGSEIDLSVACMELFVTIFASPCDREMTVRIWDSVFFLGDELMFRVGLALMQAEKEILLACKTYGDVLKQLNELGREKMDPTRVMRDAQNQECVSRARIETFRAHHRLQIASGLAFSPVEPEVNSAPMSQGPELKQEQRIPAAARRRGGAGREFRTFDRVITDTSLLEKEHPTRTTYYDGKAPDIVEAYWGTGASFGEWGRRDYRRLPGLDPNEAKTERGRLQSLGVVDSILPQDGSSDDMIKGRDRRSKSTAHVPPRRGKAVDDSHIASRPSPKGLFHRLEWGKDKRNQKDKKDKKLGQSRSSRGLDVSGTAQVSAIYAGMQVYHPRTTSPIRRHASARERGSDAFDMRANSGEIRGSLNGDEPLYMNAARAYSDPPLSPAALASHSSWPDTSRIAGLDDIDAEIVMRSQHSQRSGSRGSRSSGQDEFPPVPPRLSDLRPARPSEFRGRESTQKRSARAGNLPLRLGEPQVSSDDGTEDEDTSHRAFNLPLRLPSAQPLSASRNGSNRKRESPPALSRGRVPRDPHEEQEILHSLMVPPTIRRNMAMPLILDASYSAVVTYPRRSIVRERAQVLSYMRKQSDAGSLYAGSLPQTPHDQFDSGRYSSSSNDSSEFFMAAGQSARLPRRSSFSFLEKLSMGVEDCLEDLNDLGEDVDRFPNSNSSIASLGRWSSARSSGFQRR